MKTTTKPFFLPSFPLQKDPLSFLSEMPIHRTPHTHTHNLLITSDKAAKCIVDILNRKKKQPNKCNAENTKLCVLSLLFLRE